MDFRPATFKSLWFNGWRKSAVTSLNWNPCPDGFYTWVKFQQVWNVEFNTFDDFLYIQACDLGYLDQISPTCSSTQNILKQV